MTNALKSIKVGLMVRIWGGVQPKVRLSDVVFSQPIAGHPGVVQWDMGKMQSGGYERTGALNRPPNAVLTAIDQLKNENKIIGSKADEPWDKTARKHPHLASKYIRCDFLKVALLDTVSHGGGECAFHNVARIHCLSMV